MSPTSLTPCSACGAEAPRIFFEVQDVPALVCVLYPDVASAKACPKGDIVLRFCAKCGLIENPGFDEKQVEYTEGYENALHFSGLFQGYIQSFSQELADKHGLTGKRVIEVGSGDGTFLEQLVEHGAAEGVGFDPSYPTTKPDVLSGGKVRIVREMFTPDHPEARADLIVSRQVLEHVPQPRKMLEAVRGALPAGSGSVAVFEVPNSLRMLKEDAVWEPIYEHCLYFSAGSLARLFASCGFDVHSSVETYLGQFVAVDATTSAGAGSIPPELDDLVELTAEVDRFEHAWRTKVEGWQSRLAGWKSQDKKVAIWGTGARGVAFLNLADPTRVVERAIDINPRKHGLFSAGTGQRIDPPEALVEWQPDVVIVMNPIYTDEIRASLLELGLTPEIISA